MDLQKLETEKRIESLESRIESLGATIETLSDPEVMASIEKSLEDIKYGRVRPAHEFLKELK